MRTPILLLTVILISIVSISGQASTAMLTEPRTSTSVGHPVQEAARTESSKANDNDQLVAAAQRLEKELFGLLNAERVRKGLSELMWNDDVAKVARTHSDNMAKENFFSHRGSDGSMVDDRADRAGLGSWRVIGENIAYVRGFEKPASTAIEKWLESDAHRNNLFGPNWQESAVGVAITQDGTYYMTQVFLFRK